MNNVKLQKEYPYCYEEFVKLRGQDYVSFNAAIDNLLITFGIGVVVVRVVSETEKFLGFTSYLKIYPQNQVNRESEDIKVIEDYKKFKSSSKAEQETTTYALNFLEEYLRLHRCNKPKLLLS
jgi:hypothetical protein